MATKKSTGKTRAMRNTAGKSKAKGVPGPKKSTETRRARFVSKLDPLLMLGAIRAPQEDRVRLAGLVRTTDAVALSSVAESTTGVPALAPAKVSELPLGMHALASQMAPAALREFVDQDLVPVLVETRPRADIEAAVQGWNASVTTLTPTMHRMRVPRTRLKDLAALAAVNYVEASVRLRPHLDEAHGSARLIAANGGRTVSQRGAGVLVGIVDTGIDTAHEAFRNGARTRIVHYLDQTTGTEFTSTEIDAGTAAGSSDTNGHGTHVAGIAAGNGRGSAGQVFAGVAPEADLAIVKTTFQSDDIAEAVKRIFDLADQRRQPCVVNLSLGGHAGGHDGATVTERTIDQLSGRGRLVVISAGNEGKHLIHASTVLPKGAAAPASWTANFQLEKRVLQGQQVGLLFVQVWHHREDDIIIRLRAPNSELFQAPANGQAEFDRTTFVVQCTHQIAAYSGDHSTTFLVITDPQPQWLNGWSVLAQEDRGPGRHGVEVGAVHAWIADSEMGHFTSGHAQSHLVGMPGTAFSAITVASYATRKKWTSTDPLLPNVVLSDVELEEISYFSSPGPTRDGQNKPEITAPGQCIVAALAADASPNTLPSWTRLPGGKYAALQGTSMAAPYVTGALALLLEKEPTMDWAEAKRRLIKSARQDAHTQGTWTPRWGYGKLDLERLLTIEP